jgi:AraC-like DNA-binding protein
MKRNGVDQQQVNGRSTFDVLCRRGGRRADSDKSHIARKIEQSISYMLEHLNQPLHVSTLASAVNVSPSHYSALFKRWTGCPPIDYFIHLRMQHACRLFDSTSWNVKEVAAALGYDDPFYFSRTFKAVNRVAPSEYRAMPEKVKDSIRNGALTQAAPPPEGDSAMPEEDVRRLDEHGQVRSAGKTGPVEAVFEPLEK